jgi:hypothetical protein
VSTPTEKNTSRTSYLKLPCPARASRSEFYEAALEDAIPRFIIIVLVIANIGITEKRAPTRLVIIAPISQIGWMTSHRSSKFKFSFQGPHHSRYTWVATSVYY